MMYIITRAFQVVLEVKKPSCQSRRNETWIQSLGQEDPLEQGMAIHSSILAGESHEQRSLMGYSAWVCKESDMTERLGTA